MAEKQIIEGKNWTNELGRDFNFHAQACLGVVKNVRFVRCFWPTLDRPVALFSHLSSGIEVMGPPTPRNVVFPPDTVFLPQESDDGPIQSGVKPMRVRRWRTTDVMTKSDCYFLREKGKREVVSLEEVPEEHEIGGRRMIVKVMREKVELIDDDIITDLTVDEARGIAGVLLP